MDKQQAINYLESKGVIRRLVEGEEYTLIEKRKIMMAKMMR